MKLGFGELGLGLGVAKARLPALIIYNLYRFNNLAFSENITLRAVVGPSDLVNK